MARRPRSPSPWGERLFCLLLGVGLAIFCVSLWGRAAARTDGDDPSRRSSVGLEFSFAVHILLPQGKGG